MYIQPHTDSTIDTTSRTSPKTLTPTPASPITGAPTAVNESVAATTSGTSTKAQPSTNNQGWLTTHDNHIINTQLSDSPHTHPKMMSC